MDPRTDDCFAGLLEAAPDAMLCVDAEGKITLANTQTERLFGYRRDEMIGQPVELLMPEGVRKAHAARRHSYLSDPRPRPMGIGLELSGRRRDGSSFPAEISLSAIDTDRGTLVVAAVRDITEQQQAAVAAARLAAIIQSSHDGVIGRSLDGVITSWNPGAERLLGYRAEEMIGQPMSRIIPLEDGERETAVFAAAARGERIEQYRTRRIRKDGTVIDVSLSLSPIADRWGKIIGIAGVDRDVTERQRAEASFRGLLEAAPDAMVCVAGDGRITLVNAQTERLFGYGCGELVGQPVEILIPEADRDIHSAHRASYLADPQPRPMGTGLDLSGRRRDGSTFPAEISLSTIDTDEGTMVIAAIRDETEHREMQAERERLRGQAERDRLERQLHQSQRLEGLGHLAGGVAHDFNNLLGVISNYAAFAAEEIGGLQPPERRLTVRDDIEQVMQAAARAAELTHQLLAFARQEVIQPQVLNLNDIVTSVEQLLVRTLGEHVTLVTDLSSDLRPVLADPGQVEQVLVNLAVNARDAMPGGGKLAIRTANADIGEAMAAPAGLAPGRYVSLKVSDTGTGMPKEVVDRVFEPFFTTKAKGEGTGLGLATVYGIVTQAGGDVRLYSEPGMGTTFTVLLPATEQATAAAEAAAPRAEGGHGEVILVVEDEPALREVTRRILARNGYQVTAVANGQEALTALTRDLDHIDALLTDVIMPNIQGKELAERVRALHPAVRVLFMSGYTQGLLGAQGVLEPGVHLIEKPFSETVLLTGLHEVLDAPG